MSKINVGPRSKAGDAQALAEKTAPENLPHGAKLVQEGDKTFIVEKSQFGLTIKTRVA